MRLVPIDCSDFSLESINSGKQPCIYDHLESLYDPCKYQATNSVSVSDICDFLLFLVLYYT